MTALLASSSVTTTWAYKAKPVTPKPAAEYAAHQSFQNIVIAAYPCFEPKSAEQFFDTDRLHQNGVMPVLLVVENNNDFAVGIREPEVYLLLENGDQVSPVPFYQVVVSVSTKRPLSTVTNPEVSARQVRNRDMLEDFEQKALGEKLIAPHSSDYGFLFFPLVDSLKGSRMYLPRVYNVTEGEPLIFFEFELAGTQP